jgi:hypothetical protein
MGLGHSQLVHRRKYSLRIIYLTFVNLVTPKAGAKNELLFNKPASGAYMSGLKKTL